MALDLGELRRELEDARREQKQLLLQAAELTGVLPATLGPQPLLPPRSPGPAAAPLLGSQLDTNAPRRPKLSWGSPARARSPQLPNGLAPLAHAPAESGRSSWDGQGPGAGGGSAAGLGSRPSSAGGAAMPPALAHTPAAVDMEAIRRGVMREVIAALTGESGSRLDHFQCDVPTVVGLVRQQVAKAGEEGRAVGEKEGAQVARDQVERAAREARERSERDAATALAMGEEERKSLASQVSKLQRELDSANKERRDLMARAGQQKGQLKEAMDATQASMERAGALEKQLAAASRSAREAEKAKVDAERHAKEADVAVAAAKQEIETLKAAAARSGKQDAKVAAQALATATARVTAATAAATNTALADAAQASAAAIVEVGQCLQAARDTRLEVDMQVEGLGQELAEVRSVALSLVSQVAHEVAGVRVKVQGFRDACTIAAAQLQARTAALEKVDARLAALGPEGLEGLIQQVEDAKARGTQSEVLCTQLAEELKLSEGQRRKLAMEKQLQDVEVQMLIKSKAELSRELGALRTALERASAEGVATRARITELRAAAEARGTEMGGLREELTTARAAASKAGARVTELEAQVGAMEAAVELAQERAAGAMRSALDTVGSAAAQLVRSLRDAYFTAPPQPSAEQGQGQGSSASSTTDGGLLADLDDIVGLRLCQLSHDELMGRMERYSERQVAFGRQHTMVQVASALGHQPAAGQAHGHSSAYMQGSHSASNSSGGGGGGAQGEELPGVQLELMWLEGCLLLVLLELRQQARQLQDQALKSGSGAGAPAAAGAGAGREQSKLARGLVGQMMQAMAQEKRKLQRRISQMESLASPSLPFTAYLPLRRSLSARTSFTASTTPTPPRPPSGNTTPLPHPSSPQPTAGSAVAVLFHTPQPQPAWARRASEPSGSERDGVLPCAPLHGAGIPLSSPHQLVPGLAAANALSGSERGAADMDEVMRVLDVLDDSGLRGSRGMLGLKSAALHNRHAVRHEVPGMGPPVHSPFGGAMAQVAWGGAAPPSYQRSLSSGNARQQAISGPGSGGVLGGPVYLRGVGTVGAGPSKVTPTKKRDSAPSHSPYLHRAK